MFVSLISALVLAVTAHASAVPRPLAINPTTNHQLPEGGKIVYANRTMINILDSAGKVVDSLAVTANAAPTPISAAAAATVTGVGINYFAPAPVSLFTASWTVPPLPAQDNGQSIELVMGLEANGNVAELNIQLLYWFPDNNPALPKSWSIQSQYITTTGSISSTAVPVSPGASILTILQLFGSGSGTFDYIASTVVNGVSTTPLTVIGSPQLSFAQLDVVGVNQAGGSTTVFPPGSTTFTGITLQLSGASIPSNFAWTVDTNAALGIQVSNVNAASNAQMIVTY